MAREMYADVITQRDNSNGYLIALADIRVTVQKRNPDLSYSATVIYSTREGNNVKGSSGVFVTTDGRVEFYVDPGIYKLTFEDTTGANRISSSRYIEFSPVSYDDPRLRWQVGMCLQWPSVAAAPTGFVKLDGTAYAQTGTYAALYALVGSAYNIGGESAGTFRVPNVKGRMIVGPDVANALMTAFSSAQKAIGGYAGSVSQPAHTHQVPAHRHHPGDLFVNTHGQVNYVGDDSAVNPGVSWGFVSGSGFALQYRWGPPALGGTYVGAVGGVDGDSAFDTGGMSTAPAVNYPPFVIMDTIIAY